MPPAFRIPTGHGRNLLGLGLGTIAAATADPTPATVGILESIG